MVLIVASFNESEIVSEHIHSVKEFLFVGIITAIFACEVDEFFFNMVEMLLGVLLVL